MLLNEKNITSIISNGLNIDCLKIELTQQTQQSPLVIQGAGKIYINSEGKLKVKIYCNYENAYKDLYRSTYDHLKPGEVIKKEHLFKMKAQDLNGKTWMSENIDPYKGSHLTDNGIVIHAALHSLLTEVDYSTINKKLNQSCFIFKGKIDIPCNKYENYGTNGKKLTICEFETENAIIKINLHDAFTAINIKLTGNNIKNCIYSKVIEAICIMAGKLLTPIIDENITNNFGVQTIFNDNTQQSVLRLPELIQLGIPTNFKHFISFVTSYISHIKSHKGELYLYWLKTIKSTGNNIDNQILALTVSIEGVIKSSFKELCSSPQEFIDAAERTKIIITSLDIDHRIKERVIRNLNGAGTTTPKNALYKLVDSNILDKKIVDTWSKLRNKAAHAYFIKQNEHDKYLKEYFSCISLFYQLIILHIKWQGDYINYHVDGWPIKKFEKQLYDKDNNNTLYQ